MWCQGLGQRFHAQEVGDAEGIQLGKGWSEHLELEREQKRDTGSRYRRTEKDHGPEDQLLPRVELAGGGMALADDPACDALVDQEPHLPAQVDKKSYWYAGTSTKKK